MENIAQDQHRCQELIHFCHYDHNTYESFIRSPGHPPVPFLQAKEFDCTGCFLIRKNPPLSDSPQGYVPIPTVNVPRGSLRVFAFSLLFYLVPMLKDQPREATIVHNPDLDSGPDGTGDIAMVVITQPWPPQDPALLALEPPYQKRPHLHLVKPKKHPLLPKVSHNKAPKDVLKYFSNIPTRLTWQPVLNAMYKRSKFLESKRLTQYTGHSNRHGRFYLKGNQALADALGITARHLSNILTWLASHCLIKLRHRGYPGEGNSIWELPFNLAHVFSWRREPPH